MRCCSSSSTASATLTSSHTVAAASPTRAQPGERPPRTPPTVTTRQGVRSREAPASADTRSERTAGTSAHACASAGASVSGAAAARPRVPAVRTCAELPHVAQLLAAEAAKHKQRPRHTHCCVCLPARRPDQRGARTLRQGGGTWQAAMARQAARAPAATARAASALRCAARHAGGGALGSCARIRACPSAGATTAACRCCRPCVRPPPSAATRRQRVRPRSCGVVSASARERGGCTPVQRVEGWAW